jgi:hypothetical protein
MRLGGRFGDSCGGSGRFGGGDEVVFLYREVRNDRYR